MRAEDFVKLLSGVRRSGSERWVSQCPAHDDRSPSLSICHKDYRVLLHCHAGCTTEDILSAMGLTWAALFSNSQQYIKPEIRFKNAIKDGFKHWRKKETRKLGEELRERDWLILAIDEAVAAHAISEPDAMDLLARLYYRYSELEYRFEVLRTGSHRAALEIYRGRE